MRKVSVPVVDKEAESTNQSKQKAEFPSRPVVKDDEESEISGGSQALLPEELTRVFVPSLKIGAGAGLAGMFGGAAYGIMRTNHAFITSVATGFQWSILSSTFYGSRQVALHHLKEAEEPTSREKIKASAAGGAFAGMVTGLVRGPKSIIPGAINFCVYGAVGQYAVNAYYKRKAEAVETEDNGGFLASKWSPLTKLSDDEYDMIIKEKILRIEAEMAIIDEQIEEVRAAEAQRQRASQQLSEKEDSPSA